jgi:hypothetical protein
MLPVCTPHSTHYCIAAPAVSSCTAYAKLGCYSDACHLIRSWSQRFNKQWKAVMCLDGYYDYIHALASESSGSHTEALEYAEKAIAKDEFVREASDPDGPVADPAHVEWNEYLEWLRNKTTDAVCVCFLDTFVHASFMHLFCRSDPWTFISCAEVYRSLDMAPHLGRLARVAPAGSCTSRRGLHPEGQGAAEAGKAGRGSRNSRGLGRPNYSHEQHGSLPPPGVLGRSRPVSRRGISFGQAA